MNTKRQTVWLVSMLSLMVVLSAYYLFTQDVDKPDVLTDGSQTEQAANNATEAAANSDGLVVNEVEQPVDESILSEADKETLSEIDAQGLAAGGLFSELLAKRELKNTELENRIMAAISDSQKKPEEASAALAELEMLEEKTSKLTGIESELLKQYETVVIDEQSDKFNVVVSSEKLEKKQAADIIKLVMSTMEVGADQVSVRYIP
ncbi:stage III sporulation protein AH [Paenibacillus endophyticus]|uniref:Stage III sporulation protein AH n=1 Tax=Paenibacillus endophyticus TaxID=1294268 RepID=A0A7W5CB77_9BACL|nr:SpoIIIAH-like family protein [Paenibacillus endophyticus]MBB3154518.1 stage III sporulation protein AH [Paenibacillus endophyticus]